MTTTTWQRFVASTETVSAIGQARRDMMLSTAEGAALTTIGQNYGVRRPPLLTDDEIYRRCVQVLAWQPKMILFTTHALMTAVFGSPQQLVADGERPWRIYEVNANEIIIEVPSALLAQSNATASYYHGWDGYAYNATGSASDEFTTEGDVRTTQSTTLVGTELYAYVGGAWSAYEILAVSYSSTTNLSTLQIDTVAIDPGGTLFHITHAGDDSQSYKGDYVAPSGQVATFSTAAGSGTTNTITMPGDATLELSQDMTLSLIYSGQPHTAVITSPPSYTTTALPPTAGDYTTFDVDILVPEGLTAGVVVKAIERADTTTTAVHDDRVYFTENGLYAVFDYYFNALVRAAGIVVRFERI